MKTALTLAGSVVALAACVSRPGDLRRVEQLDAECKSGSVAFVYRIGSGADRAVSSGCYAPIGAWTDEADLHAGGTRKLVYELREKEKSTLLCCKP